MEDIDEQPICPECNGSKVVRTGFAGGIKPCESCDDTGRLR
jgi:ribosomal protein L37AE/L43A